MRFALIAMVMLALVAGLGGQISTPAQAAGWTIDPDGAP